MIFLISEDYRELSGTNIPYKRLGYNSLDEFLDHGTDFCRISYDQQGQIVIRSLPTQNTAHISHMVAKQRSTSKKRSAKMPVRQPYSQRGSWQPNNVRRGMTGQRRPRGQGPPRRGGGALRPANDSQNGGWSRPQSNFGANNPRSAMMSSPPQPLMQMNFVAKKSNSLSSNSSKSSQKDNRNYLEELNQFCDQKGIEKPSFKVIINYND